MNKIAFVKKVSVEMIGQPIERSLLGMQTKDAHSFTLPK